MPANKKSKYALALDTESPGNRTVLNRLKGYLIIVMLINLAINIIYFSFQQMNSDFVANRLLFDEFFKSRVFLSPDSYFIKFPLYWAVFQLFGDTIWSIALLNMINLSALAALVGFTYNRMTKPQFNNLRGILIYLLPLWVLINLSTPLYAFLSNPFTRNIDIGIMFWVLLLQFEGKLNSGRRRIGAGILMTLVLLSDPFFVYLMVVPVGFCLLLLFLAEKKIKATDGWFMAMLSGATVAAYSLRDWLNRSNTFQIQKEAASFIDSEQLVRRTTLLIRNVSQIFGGSFFGQPVLSSATIHAVANLALLGAAVWGLYLLAKRALAKNDPVTLYFPVAAVLNVLIFFLSTVVRGESGGRYLIVLPFVSAFGLYAVLDKIRLQQQRFFIAVATAVTSIILGINMLNPSMQTVLHASELYADNRKILEVIRAEHLTYGYGDFWDAGLNTYLSKGEIKIRQVTIESGRLSPYMWVSSRAWYESETHQGASFVLIDDSWMTTTVDGQIQSQVFADQLGVPSRQKLIETSEKTYRLLIYPYNIASRF